MKTSLVLKNCNLVNEGEIKPVDIAINGDRIEKIATSLDIEAEKVRLGLDKPFFYRYGKWVSDIVVRQDFGDSCILRMNINDLLSGRFVLSLTICLVALIFSYLIGFIKSNIF